jgi:hypothetical protein
MLPHVNWNNPLMVRYLVFFWLGMQVLIIGEQIQSLHFDLNQLGFLVSEYFFQVYHQLMFFMVVYCCVETICHFDIMTWHG